MAVKKRATDDQLGELQIEVTKQLLARIRSGEATPADYSAAIKLLANNHIETVTVKGDPLDTLAEAALPVFNDDEPDEASYH